MDFRIISIGTLAANPLWGERTPVRTGHATTTLVTVGNRRILIDPGLPAQVLVARLAERANLVPDQITDVFLTTYMPDTRRALTVFEEAAWWISNEEREAVGVSLARRIKEMMTDDRSEQDDELRKALEMDIAILQRCKPAPDSLAERVDLFPLPGVTPGLCGLLLEGPRATVLICGDAVPTVEHLEQGKVLTTAVDVERARQSFEEAVEIADLLVLGRDNVVVNPTRKPF